MITYSRVNCLKTIPFIAAHTYIAPPPPGPDQLVVPAWTTFIAYTVGKFFLLIGASSRFSRSPPDVYLPLMYQETWNIGLHQDKIQRHKERA